MQPGSDQGAPDDRTPQGEGRREAGAAAAGQKGPVEAPEPWVRARVGGFGACLLRGGEGRVRVSVQAAAAAVQGCMATSVG